MFKNKYRVTKPRGRSTTSSSLPSKRGLFEKGVWLCDCDPRLPAERFQVKKDGKNKGRWFYTCQKAQELRCSFFLWADDAALRMEATVLANGPTEPTEPIAAPATTSDAPPRNDPEWPTRPSPPKRRKLPWATDQAAETRASPKRRLLSPSVSPPPLTRKHADKPDNDNEAEDPFALSSSDESALAALPTTPQPKTPRQPARLASATGLPTPGTTPQTRRAGPAAPPDTPTRTRTHDALDTDAAPASASASLSARVTALLQAHGVQLPAPTALALRALLETEARRAAGLARGRDAARAAVAVRERRIAELAGRVGRLEGDVEAERGLRRAVRRG